MSPKLRALLFSALLLVAAGASCGTQHAASRVHGAAPSAAAGFAGGAAAKHFAGTAFDMEAANTESFAAVVENRFRRVPDEPVSTFSVDVDTASYALVRRMLRDGRLPPSGAVRLEEMVNYFPAADAGPDDGGPLAVRAEAAACPWTAGHRLVRIAVKARDGDPAARPSANLVFLVDVSGSMASPDKLPLVQEGLELLAGELRADDRVSLVVYAGTSGLVLDATPGDRRETIVGAVERLEAGGSTNGGAGIRLAYETARRAFVRGGVNRVVLCTDGDFNVGVSSRSDLAALVEDEARSGVFLSVLGFGVGNVKDDTMQTLADRGNGNYAYVDGLREARKVLVEQAGSTLVTLAKDVKIQVEFNPAAVAAYRLLGYENRLLEREDFRDDAKDAGEMGTGHVVTALYEVIPAGGAVPGPGNDALKYQATPALSASAHGGEMLTVRVRWKEPDAAVGREIASVLRDDGRPFAHGSADLRFAAAVAEFASLLRGSKFAGNTTWEGVLEIAGDARGADPGGHRAEFLDVVRRARDLSAR